MEDGQNGVHGRNVPLVVDLELSQELELAPHQHHQEMDYCVQEKIRRVNHVKPPDAKVNRITI